MALAVYTAATVSLALSAGRVLRPGLAHARDGNGKSNRERCGGFPVW